RVELIGSLRRRRRVDKISRSAAARRVWNQTSDLDRRRIEARSGDTIARKCGPDLRATRSRDKSGRIEDSGAGRAEVPRLNHGPLRNRGDGGNRLHWLANPNALVVAEEECLVAPDRSADRAAEFIAAKGLFRPASAIVEERVGVQLVVAQKLIDAAMELVRPRLALHDGHGPGRRPVLGGVVARHHSDFLNGIDGRYHDNAIHP